MKLILLTGQLINTDYIRKVKALDKGGIAFIKGKPNEEGKYFVCLDNGEEIMITWKELDTLWPFILWAGL